MAHFDTHEFIDTLNQKQRHQDLKVHQHQRLPRRSDMLHCYFFVEILPKFRRNMVTPTKEPKLNIGTATLNIAVRIRPKPEI